MSRRSALPLVVAAAFGLVLIVVVRLIASGDSVGATGARPDDADCVQVSIAASPDKSAVLSQLSDRYDETDPQVDGQCVQTKVTTIASGVAADALVEGWNDSVHGTRPVVWAPASRNWAVLAEARASDRDQPSIVPADRPSLIQSPLVIAMPQPMAQALGWPDKPIGWTDLAELARNPKGWASAGHPEWGQFKLGKMNPHVSTFGLDATIASFFAATGVSTDLTIAQVRDAKTRAFVRDLESSIVHYGDTSLTFLANMSQEAADGRGLTYVSAVTLEEKSVLDYNLGNPSGDPRTLGQGAKPAIPLVAVYPSDGTFMSDHPWLPLDAGWVNDRQRSAAAAMLTWLQEPAQQATFQAAGFRSFRNEPGDAHTQANGLLPQGAVSVLDPPAPKVLAEIERSWDELRKRAHVLFVMDVSGSMGEEVSGASKLALAQRAVSASLDGLAADDEVGLWSFSTNLGANGEPWQELRAVGPASTNLAPLRARIDSLVPSGGTGLYATLRAAQTAMLADLDPERINAIVILTDGKNENPADNDLNSLLDQLHGETPDTSIRVFPIGYGSGADPVALKAIADAARGHYYEATDPASIERVLTSVLSNF